MPTEPAGKAITANEANNYLQKFVTIRENLQKEALPLKNLTVLNGTEKVDLEALYSSDVNAFIFSKELIMRFFQELDENGQSQPTANFLMVILGAKYQSPDTIGTPTVVVAGVNKDVDGNYTSLNIPLAADQQPPTGDYVKFPDPASPTPAPVTIKIRLL